MTPSDSARKGEMLVSKFDIFSLHSFQDMCESSSVLGCESASFTSMIGSHGTFHFGAF